MPVDKVRQRVSAAQPLTPIPDKLYFKIGEVAELVGVPAHVLRYWEREVSAIRPGKSASRQRRYRRKDVEIFREIRRLLYTERYTLAGARRRLLGAEPEESSALVLSEDGASVTSDAVAVSAPDAQQVAAAGPVGEGAAKVASSDGPLAGDANAAPLLHPSRAPQLDLGFPVLTDHERRERLRSSLRELIRMAGEEP